MTTKRKRYELGQGNVDPANFLYLGRNGDANALENEVYSARTPGRAAKPAEQKSAKRCLLAQEENSSPLMPSQTGKKSTPQAVFDNNCYTFAAKKDLSKSPKMADYIHEVYQLSSKKSSPKRAQTTQN